MTLGEQLAVSRSLVELLRSDNKELKKEVKRLNILLNEARREENLLSVKKENLFLKEQISNASNKIFTLNEQNRLLKNRIEEDGEY
jgi:hypothetical protein